MAIPRHISRVPVKAGMEWNQELSGKDHRNRFFAASSLPPAPPDIHSLPHAPLDTHCLPSAPCF